MSAVESWAARSTRYTNFAREVMSARPEMQLVEAEPGIGTYLDNVYMTVKFENLNVARAAILVPRSNLIEAAGRVIRAFEAYGKAGRLVAEARCRQECEAAMVALKECHAARVVGSAA